MVVFFMQFQIKDIETKHPSYTSQKLHCHEGKLLAFFTMCCAMDEKPKPGLVNPKTAEMFKVS